MMLCNYLFSEINIKYSIKQNYPTSVRNYSHYSGILGVRFMRACNTQTNPVTSIFTPLISPTLMISNTINLPYFATPTQMLASLHKMDDRHSQKSLYEFLYPG